MVEIFGEWRSRAVDSGQFFRQKIKSGEGRNEVTGSDFERAARREARWRESTGPAVQVENIGEGEREAEGWVGAVGGRDRER